MSEVGPQKPAFSASSFTVKYLAGLLGAVVLLGACTSSEEPTATTQPIQTTEASVTSEVTPTSEADPTTVAEPATTEPQQIQVGTIVEGTGTITATVTEVLPHDFQAQTQGLAWGGDALVESTGVYGSSERRFLSPTSAQTSQEKFLAPELLATDVAIVGDTGIQLSGFEGIATTFSAENLNEIGQIRFEGEGWGLCLDDDALVMSDNTDVLVRRDSLTLAIEAPQPSPEGLTNLRALECAKDRIWAVVGDTNTVAIIDRETGELEDTLDLAELVPSTSGPNDALSAIAYDPNADIFYVAGRRWGVFYGLTIAGTDP